MRQVHSPAGVITSFAVLLIINSSNHVFAQESQPKVSARSSSATSTTAPITDKIISAGTIEGRVVGDGDKVPANTVVSIRVLNGASKTSRTTRVDTDGRFVFEDLPPAAYTLTATAPAYIDDAFASGDTSELPRHFIGSQVRIRLVRGGVITGTVTNARGNPVVGVNVFASPLGDQRDIAATYAREAMNVETDDRGIYRIYGLLPGDYVVSAGGRGIFGRLSGRGFELDTPTHYPSSTRDTAIPVTVRSGEEVTGIDIKYKGQHGHSISGVILHKGALSTDADAFSVGLWHVKTDTLLSMTESNVGQPHHSFSFEGVADGEYELSTAFFPSPTSAGFSGTKRVSVRGGDVTGVGLSLTPLSLIQGVLKLDPTKTDEKCDKRGSQLLEVIVNATSESAKPLGRRPLAGMYAGLSTTIAADNTFNIQQVEPGKFRFDIRLPTDAWYLREIKMPASPTKDTPQQSPPPALWQGMGTIKPGESISGVEITVGQDAATLNGRVTLPKGMSVSPQGLEVHLVPVDREHANNVLRYYETRVDSDGQFKVSHIAPAHYFVVARIRPDDGLKEHQTPAAWNMVGLAQLRRQAETSKTMIELKGCQRLTDYALTFNEIP